MKELRDKKPLGNSLERVKNVNNYAIIKQTLNWLRQENGVSDVCMYIFFSSSVCLCPHNRYLQGNKGRKEIEKIF